MGNLESHFNNIRIIVVYEWWKQSVSVLAGKDCYCLRPAEVPGICPTANISKRQPDKTGNSDLTARSAWLIEPGAYTRRFGRP